jgi:NADP-dependent 3-hydroxy acid dehydrogenase YdfG
MAQLDGQVFIVSGGGGAIARPILQAFADAGANVVVVDRGLEHASRAAETIGGLALAADLTTRDGAEQTVEAVITQLGRVDGLIHTVGGFAMGKVLEIDPAQYDQMFDLNVRTLFHTVRAVLPHLLTRKSGFLAAFSSEPAWTGAGPGKALYAAAKSAVATFLRSLDGELAGTAIRVSVVYPMGAVDTPANRRDMPDFDPAGYIDPADIAATLLCAATLSPRARLPELPIFPAR